MFKENEQNLETVFFTQYSDLLDALKAHGVHECADFFPYMEEKNLHKLAHDIQENGQQETIKCIDGKIIDGRNRFMACVLANIVPDKEEIEVENTLDYVLSRNLWRQHLKETQRAWVAANIVLRKSISKVEAAKIMNIGPRSVSSAMTVMASGTKELQDKVQFGKIAVSQAEKIAKLDQDEQDSLLLLSKTQLAKALRNKKTKDASSNEPKTIEVVVFFTEDEIRQIDNASRQLSIGGRMAFIHEAAMRCSKDWLPPTKEEQKEFAREYQFKGYKPKFLKKRYSDKSLSLGKLGITKQEADYQKEEEAFEEAKEEYGFQGCFETFLEVHDIRV